MPRLDLLTIAADHFEKNVSQFTFNMHNWKLSRSLECGTVGCFIGHACDIPEINEAGLYLAMDEENNIFPAFKIDEGPEAVAKFFEISYKEMSYLFMPGSYTAYPNERISKEDVLYRIRQFIKDKQ